jgi:hypothetical protein
MAAALAFEADVRTEPHNSPLIRAAGVRFSQTDEVLKLKVGKHFSVFIRYCAAVCATVCAAVGLVIHARWHVNAYQEAIVPYLSGPVFSGK